MVIAHAFDAILKKDPNSSLNDSKEIYDTILNTTFTGEKPGPTNCYFLCEHSSSPACPLCTIYIVYQDYFVNSWNVS